MCNFANYVSAGEWDNREYKRPLDLRFTDYYESNWLNMPVLTIDRRSSGKIESYMKNGTSIHISIEPEASRSAASHHHTMLLLFALLVFPAVLVLGIVVYSRS